MRPEEDLDGERRVGAFGAMVEIRVTDPGLVRNDCESVMWIG